MGLKKYRLPNEKIGLGYSDEDAIKADIALLTAIDGDPQKREQPDALKALALGKACALAHPIMEQKLIDMCRMNGALQKLMVTCGSIADAPPQAEPDEWGEYQFGDLAVMMGDLKKVPRIMEKAVNYAVTDGQNANRPVLERVVDVLRATVIIENPTLLLSPIDNGQNVGSRIIDVFNGSLGGLVQVKNRLMDVRQPVLFDYTAANFSSALDKSGKQQGDEYACKDLVDQITTLVSVQLKGRDAFYRDLQLLIKVPTEQAGLSHVYFEVQITTRELVQAKTGKKKPKPKPQANQANQAQEAPEELLPKEKLPPLAKVGTSGHKAYKKIRAVMEYCEYVYWRWKNKKDNADFQIALDKKVLADFFPDPLHADFQNFEKELTAMWEVYKKLAAKYKGPIEKAIDDSDWYKNANK